MNIQEEKTYHFNQVVEVILRKKKSLLIVTLIAIILSSVASLLIEDKFKSTVILYPTTINSISKSVLAENSNAEDILAFGEIEQSEQLIQILNSDEIRRRVIDQFNLVKHYEIDPEDSFKQSKLLKEFNNNVDFKLTKYMAVEISVLDKEAQTAADIANHIAILLDSVKNRMRKDIALKGYKIVEDQYQFQKDYIQGLEDSLVQLRKLGVLDYESQAERITEQLATAILQGKTRATEKLQQRLDVLTEYGGAYVSIRDQLEFEKKQFTIIKTKYQEAKVDAFNDLTHKFVVNSAYPAEKACYPIRWLIVIISTLSALILAVLILLSFSKK